VVEVCGRSSVVPAALPGKEGMHVQFRNRIAFKEWAVVCAALELGRQTLILRKGGLREGREGFRVQHRDFWLFPTRFHQQPEELAADSLPLWEQVLATRPGDDLIPIRQYAVVHDVLRIEDAALLAGLHGLTILSPATIAARFGYREPGLFVLPVRVYRLDRPIEISNSPHYAGCRTWVDLETELSTNTAQPVLGDQEAARRFKEIRRAISSTGTGQAGDQGAGE